MTDRPNPIHTHPEGPPEGIPLREYLEGRLSRLDTDAVNKTTVLRELYDIRIKDLASLVDQRFAAQQGAVEIALTAQKEAVAAALAAQTALTDQRFGAQAEAVEKALTAQKEAIITALAAVERESRAHADAHSREHQAQAVAIEKAEKRSDERFTEANNFRSQIESERMTYVRRDMLDVMERNTRQSIEKAESDARLRAEKLENDSRLRVEKAEEDFRARLEKIESDLRQRIEVETASRDTAIRPLINWMQRSGGQQGVWIAIGGVAVTVVLALVIFLANWATR